MAIGTAVMSDPSTLAEHRALHQRGAGRPACYVDIAEELGRFAWRRPLTAEEVTTITDIAQRGVRSGPRATS